MLPPTSVHVTLSSQVTDLNVGIVYFVYTAKGACMLLDDYHLICMPNAPVRIKQFPCRCSLVTACLFNKGRKGIHSLDWNGYTVYSLTGTILIIMMCIMLVYDLCIMLVYCLPRFD